MTCEESECSSVSCASLEECAEVGFGLFVELNQPAFLFKHMELDMFAFKGLLH